MTWQAWNDMAGGAGMTRGRCGMTWREVGMTARAFRCGGNLPRKRKWNSNDGRRGNARSSHRLSQRDSPSSATAREKHPTYRVGSS